MRSTLTKVWHILSHAERRGAIVLLALMMVGMGFEMLGVGLVVPVMSVLASPESFVDSERLPWFSATLAGATNAELALWAMAALVFIYTLKTIFLAYLGWRQARFTYAIMAQVSQRLFGVYLAQPYTFHLQRNSAQLIRNAMTETQIFALSVVGPALSLLAELLVFIGLFTLLVYLEPVGALIVFGVLGIAAGGFFQAVRKPITRWGCARQHHEGQRIQRLQQGLGAAKDVILLGRTGEFLDQYRTHSAASARVAGLQTVVSLLPRLWLELLAVIGMAILVLTMVAQGKQVSEVLPVLGVFAAAALRLIPSVNRVLVALSSLRYGLPVIETLHAEMHLVGTEARAGVRGPRGRFQRGLRLDDVGYRYPGARGPALVGISLEVGRGETVGFIGASGAGKSTLVDVLLGLLEPTEGAVLVDGADIRADRRGWQDQIGYVPQDIFLTDDTLRRNIAFGLPDDEISEEAVLRAVHAAQLEGFIAHLPEGLGTVVGERGVRLSGGQRQRIGIARALYHDPPVLVLDEATSALDNKTEADVMDAIRALHGVKTIMIVAHRLTTVAHCDRIYRLGQGHLLAEGPPEALLGVAQPSAGVAT